ncbi:hypothetical protein AM10699_31450 [Acaryochloris marina MBIC10699]|nr:hypothetical protein AM10699_31450 [Acaryochloris marina MBIC10699]
MIGMTVNMPSIAQYSRTRYGVDVELYTFVDSYNPRQNQESGDIEIKITNKTDKKIELPSQYDGSAISLFALQETEDPRARVMDQHLIVRNATSRPKKKFLSPGETYSYGKLPLNRIFDKEIIGSEGKYYWNWLLHAPPKATPIYDNKWEFEADKLVDTVVLWAEVKIGDQITRSTPKIISIQNQEFNEPEVEAD